MFKTGQVAKDWAIKNNINHQYRQSTDSTNDWAKSLEDFSKFNLLLTNSQTQGRGRRTNQWQETSPGAHLASSWSYPLSSTPHPALSAKIGLAIVKSLYSTWNCFSWALKAPNDIYLKDKKLAGILIENITQGDQHLCILGIGLNVWQSPMDTATCLQDILATKDLTSENFQIFLTRCKLELDISMEKPHLPLSPNERKNLREILNKFYDISLDPIIDISSEGNIIYKSGHTIHWQNL